MNILERIRYSRNCTNDTFPLPSVVDCVWYAVTEFGEAIDARLRMAQPEHVRNNARNVDSRCETGQCVYMLGSAFIQLHKANTFKPWPPRYGESTVDFAIADACRYTTNALTDVLLGDQNGITIMLAMQAWCHVCTLQGWDVDALIDETCADFERKHCIVREVA